MMCQTELIRGLFKKDSIGTPWFSSSKALFLPQEQTPTSDETYCGRESAERAHC